MGPSLGGVIVGFLLLAAVFWPLERRFAAQLAYPFRR